MNCDYNAYEGKKIKGVVETVLSRGKVVIDKGEFKGKAGAALSCFMTASCHAAANHAAQTGHFIC